MRFRSRGLALGAAASVAFALLASGAVTASPTANVSAAPKLKLLWSEEFNDKFGIPPTVQTSQRRPNKKYNWTTEVTGNPNNAERQYYTDSVVEYTAAGKVAHYAIEVDGKGNLALNARAPKFKTKTAKSTYPPLDCRYGRCEWVSGRMNTQGKLGFMYGKLEARIKLPEGDGTWPAFWMLGANIEKVNWPSCGELDIMEASAFQRYGSIFGSLHSQPDDGFGISSSAYPEDFYTKYHTYGIVWTKDRIDFLSDGQVYNTVTKADMTSRANAVKTEYGVQKRTWPFNAEFFIILNLAMGGSLGGDPDNEFKVPAGAKGGSMLVDWIRYYSVDGVGKVIRH